MEHLVIIEGTHAPREDIVLVEPYVPSSESPIKSGKPFRARIVRRIGRAFLTEMTSQEFAAQHGFRVLSEDNIAINPDPAIRFDVESLTPTDTFNPDKPYLTRLTWPGATADRDGRKLLLAEPKGVFAVAKTLKSAKTGQILQTVRSGSAKLGGVPRRRRDGTTPEA